MDSGRGHFEKIPEDIFNLAEEKWEKSGVFKVGELLEIKGSKFKVQRITPKKLILKLRKSD